MGCHFGRPSKFFPPPLQFGAPLFGLQTMGPTFFSFPSSLRSLNPDPAGCAPSRRHPPASYPPPTRSQIQTQKPEEAVGEDEEALPPAAPVAPACRSAARNW